MGSEMCIRDSFRSLLTEGIFERYVALDFDEIGKVAAIYDAALQCVYRG